MISGIVFLPLLGAVIAGLIAIYSAQRSWSIASHEQAQQTGSLGSEHETALDPRVWGSRFAELLTTGLVIVSAVLSWIVFIQMISEPTVVRVGLMRFLDVGSLQANWVLRVDSLTAVMFVVVTTVSAAVHVYSTGYMSHDCDRSRFFAYLSFFTFSMLVLVTSDNFVQLFFGWEAVGLASYLLIGFWYKKSSANAASIKAFVVNRVGDFGFALGIFGVFLLFGSLNFDAVFSSGSAVAVRSFNVFGLEINGLTVVCLLLFVGAMGKSAQFLLHTWLPDAMEGPTPVSALIHAATMVTAGVFLVVRLSPLFEASPTAAAFVIAIGAVTALFGASVGLFQNDIKRIIAYSTCSQLGYMFVAAGVGAYSLALFHLFTHAFFKALLFLGAGSVIHAVHGQQDIRAMGGLRRYIPFTYAAMLAGTFALTGVGIPYFSLGFAGFFSKDAIVEAAFVSQSLVASAAFFCLVFAALLTAFYSWRLIFLVFEGSPRWSNALEPHESPGSMLGPLALLGVGAVVAGAVFKQLFVDETSVRRFFSDSIFLGSNNHILHDLHTVPVLVVFAPSLAMIVGFILALIVYQRHHRMAGVVGESQRVLYRFLLNKWYFDELYVILFVRPCYFLGRVFSQNVDRLFIDRFGADGIANQAARLTGVALRVQSGLVYHYAFVMLLGLSAFVSWYLLSGGSR